MDDAAATVQLGRLTEAIQASRSIVDGDDAGERDLDGAVVTGWVVVTEWMSPDGERWLTELTSEDMTSWQRTGMLVETLDGLAED